ncbi:hypothetical protein MFUL124B02_37415 [Myxococcus fulvus 124B02]|nr:hypothetical protein MFUL124B02_37415 [Myxococcus fulvus 124B02]
MTEKNLREYKAIIWTEDPSRPGLRVTVMASSLDEAHLLLEREHGKGNAYNLHNEEDAKTPRLE